MGQSIKPWVGLAAFVGFLIVVAGWFLLVSPTRAATADTRANIESESNRTITLTKALDTLKTQFKTLDASRAELEDISVQVPNAADAARFRRLIDERATTSGVTIMSVTTGVSTVVTQAAAPADTTATTGATGSETATPTPSPSPAAEAPASNVTAVTTASGQVLVGIPLEITVLGKYDAARAFIASLQVTEGRLFLVSGLGVVSQLESPGSGARPETASGDVELTIAGYLLVLTPGPDDVTNPSDVPSPAPLPSTERNPFAPVVSSAPVG